jgi:GH15 family glucan-1,4-alpha-glucosidase
LTGTNSNIEILQPTTDIGDFPKIQDYALIGDCRSAALVSNRGCIEWLCWPRFDRPSIFAAILDRERGGHWLITPTQPYRVRRKYLGDSNVLYTEFICLGGSAGLTDLMAIASEEHKEKFPIPEHEIIRELECASGEVEFRFDFHAIADYGLKRVKLRTAGRLGTRVEVDGAVYWLRSTHPLTIDGDRVQGVIRLRAGEKAQFALTYGEYAPMVLPPLGEITSLRMQNSIDWWHQWARRAKYDGPYRDLVVRSALALKALAYSPSGAVIAAATTSLPEHIGSSLNWDYRYCWLRDASLSTRSLLGLGYWDEADSFLNWMLYATALTRPQLLIMYNLFGENAPKEIELDHLSGYRGSRPVRIGNGARSQLQLDVYGEVVDAAAQFAHSGGEFDRSTQRVLRGIGKYVCEHWSEPDEGIWESRGGRRPHTNSRLMCWVALDRLIRLSHQKLLAGAPIDEYKRERTKIYRDIKQHSWNQRLGSYTGELGGDSVDAATLLMSYYGFEKPDGDRMRSTYRVIRERLGTSNGLIYRYRPQQPEGAFGICGFWEVDYLALGGASLDDARKLFERQCAFANDVGLFAEEIDPDTGDALGNFPQAFTHVGLISAALTLHERQSGQRPLKHRPESAEHAHQETA